MILINLLPHREAAKKRRKEAFQVNMVLAALGGLLIAALIYWYFQMMIEGQQNKNNLLRSEIKVLETQIKEIEGLEAEITALRARQKAVEDLQSDRNLPVYMLNEPGQAAAGGCLHQQHQAGRPVGDHAGHRTVERAYLRDAAQSDRWLTLVLRRN